MVSVADANVSSNISGLRLTRSPKGDISNKPVAYLKTFIYFTRFEELDIQYPAWTKVGTLHQFYINPTELNDYEDR